MATIDLQVFIGDLRVKVYEHFVVETAPSEGASGNWKFLKYGAGEGWGRSVGPIV
jgi:hypothetical protein